MEHKAEHEGIIIESAAGHGSEEIHKQIKQLMTDSKDPEFTCFLNQLGHALWIGQIDDQTAVRELTKNLDIYRIRMQQRNLTDNFEEISEKITEVKTEELQKLPPGTIREIEKPVIGRFNREKKNMEFAIGAGVLGILGAIFLLTAFVIFAMNFLSGLGKGICLYGIAAAVLALSELFVRKRQEKFALGMSGAAFCGLFLTTLINYVYFSVFNSVVAVLLTVLTVLAAFLLDYRRDSGLFRLVALTGSICCLFPVIGYRNLWSFLIVGGITILLQLGAAFLPVSRKQDGILIFQMITVCFGVLLFSNRAVGKEIASVWISALIVLMLAVLNLLFVKTKMQGVGVVVYSLGYFCSILAFYVKGMREWQIYVILLLPLALITIISVLLGKHRVWRWTPYWLFLLAEYILCCIKSEWRVYSWFTFAYVLTAYLISKGLSRVRELRFSECAVTAFTLLYLSGIPVGKDGGVGQIWELTILTAVFLVSVFFLRYCQAFHKIAITLAAVVFAAKLCPSAIELPIITGILVTGIFLFGLVNRWKDQGMRVYNICNLCMLGFCYIGLLFEDQILIFVIMLCFGVTVILLCFDKKFALTDKNKALWLGVFLTYMFMALRVPHTVITSVLLIATAILCVGMGFVCKQKAARIYGLALAIYVALKVALLDFSGMKALIRMFAFLIVGILILAISYIYIRLEKQIKAEAESGQKKQREMEEHDEGK